MRGVLSASQQEANQYAGGAEGYLDSEEFWCTKVVAVAAADLRAVGFDILTPATGSYSGNVAAGNAFTGKEGFYLAVHTNAHNTLARGTVTFFKTGKDPAFAIIIHEAIAPLTDAPDQGVKATTLLGEVNRPTAPDSALIEIVFHDNLTDAAEMRAKYEMYGHAIAAAIIKRYGVQGTPTGGTSMFIKAFPTPGFIGMYRLRKGDDTGLAVTIDQLVGFERAGYTCDEGVWNLAPGGTVPLHQYVLGGFHLYAPTHPGGKWVDEGVVAMVHPADVGTTIFQLWKNAGHLYSTEQTEGVPTWRLDGPAFGLGIIKPAEVPVPEPVRGWSVVDQSIDNIVLKRSY